MIDDKTRRGRGLRPRQAPLNRHHCAGRVGGRNDGGGVDLVEDADPLQVPAPRLYPRSVRRILDAKVGARRLDDWGQVGVVARIHRGEEVMYDLVVEPNGEEAPQPGPRAVVAGAHDLVRCPLRPAAGAIWRRGRAIEACFAEM